jgi:hypothetical protein
MSLASFDIRQQTSHHLDMRTTLTLDDDVQAEAAKRAELLGVSLGKVVSDLARRGLAVAPPVRESNGLSVFDPPEGSPKITARIVKNALREFP